LIVVLDASTFVSAALKANSLPERALLRAIDKPNRLILLQQEVEDEYREVIFRQVRSICLRRASPAHPQHHGFCS